jgi:APA family basic amino acid/polyamine antiporter
LAAMMPRAGGQYVYLRQAYGPLWGFLYGWSLFLVIQTGTIAAVAVAFSRYLGVLMPAVSPTVWLVPPVNLSANYALSLSTQQGVAILLVVALTFINTRGLRIGKLIQNVFTSAKTLSLIILIVIGCLVGRNPEVVKANFSQPWAPQGVSEIQPDLSFIAGVVATGGAFGLFVAFCVAQVGSLFSSDAWNNITFTAGEVKNPRRNLPLSLALGTGLVTALYLLANLAYLCLLPLAQIQHAPDDRVATAAMDAVFHGAGPVIMAVAIMISTFGCNNGIILSGARVYYAMAKDGLFFRSVAKLHPTYKTPAVSLMLQMIWTCMLCVSGSYGQLLDYITFAVLVFYILTIVGLFVLRRTRPRAERPYRALGYPVLPAIYIVMAFFIDVVLLRYKPQYTWPGLMIVLLGVPVYYMWSGKSRVADGEAQP